MLPRPAAWRTSLALPLLLACGSPPGSFGSSAESPGAPPAPTPVPPPFDWLRFPHFRWRARVASASPGAVPATTSFALFDQHHGRPLGGNSSVAVAGTAWSEAVVFDNATVARCLGIYPNTMLIDSPGGSSHGGFLASAPVHFI